MRPNYLFPFNARYFGFALILIHIPVKFWWDSRGDSNFLFSPPHLFFIGTTLMVLIGLVAWSRERVEDEQITQLRLSSLRWAIYPVGTLPSESFGQIK